MEEERLEERRGRKRWHDYPEKLRFTIELTELQLEGLRKMVEGFDGYLGTPEAFFASMMLCQIRKQRSSPSSGN